MFTNLLKATALTALGMTIVEAHANQPPFMDYHLGQIEIGRTVIEHPVCQSAVVRLSAERPRIVALHEIASGVERVNGLAGNFKDNLDVMQALGEKMGSYVDVDLYCAFYAGLAYGGIEGLLMGVEAVQGDVFGPQQ